MSHEPADELMRTAGPAAPSARSQELATPATESATSASVQAGARTWTLPWLAGVVLFGAMLLQFTRLAGDPLTSDSAQAYYHFATDAFLARQWHLPLEPRPELAELANPYDPAQNGPYRILDLSYYQGKYFFYWSMVPVVLLLAPFRVLTDLYLSEPAVNAIFGTLLFGATSWLLLTWRSRHFPRVRVPLLLLGIATVGIGSLSLWLATDPGPYGAPIMSAAAWQALAWVCIDRALRSPSTVGRWTAGAGLALGLAIASRPNHVLWYIVYAFPLWVLIRQHPQRWPRLLAAAAIPPAMCVGALLWANWARFGSITEFGMRYQLTGPLQPEVLFSLADMVRNLGVYVWNPPQVSRYFPFFNTPAAGPFGALSTLPVIWLMVALLFWRGFSAGRVASGTAALAGLGGMLGTCTFFGCGTRYMVDFLPGCVLAGVTGGFFLVESARQSRRRLVGGLLALVLASSAAIALALQLQVWVLRGWDFRPVARWLNAPAFLLDQWQGRAHGPLSVTVRLPRDRPGSFEPLLSVGREHGGGEVVIVHYVDERRIRLGFFQTGTTHWFSEPLAVDYDQPHSLFVSLGSLLPPESHPVFNGWTPGERRRAVSEAVVGWNGQEVFRTSLEFPGGGFRAPVLGHNTVASGVSSDSFGGEVLQENREPVAPDMIARHLVQPILDTTEGPWRLRVQFPADGTVTTRDPLLVSGAPGAGNFVYAFYPQPGQVAFGHDAWGVGGSTSRSLAIDIHQEHEVVISHGGLYPSASPVWRELPPERQQELRRLRIWLNGALVMDVADRVYPADPASVTAGENRIGGSSTSARFSGTILSAERVPEKESR